MASSFSRRAALAGAAAALLPSTVRSQSTLQLKLAGVPEDSVTPVLYADKAGVFKRYNLTVSLSPERSGSAIAAGIVGGAFDVAKSSLVGLIVAHSKGIPFVLVAAGGVYSSTNPIVALLEKADSPIKTAADLNGKVIAVSALGDIYSLATLAWMDQNGGASSTVKQLEFSVSAVPDALASGRVDAGCVIEPILQRALDTGKVRALAHPFDAIASHFLYTGWFATAEWATRHQAETLAFNHAMRDASAYANTHLPQTIDLLSSFTSVPASEIAKMSRVTFGSTLDPKLIQPVIDGCAKYKFISSSFDASELIAPALR